MSRSFKKTPIVKDNNNGRASLKRAANKRVRHTKDIPNGKSYRKQFNTYAIYDQCSYCTWLEFKAIDRLWHIYPTEDEMHAAWRRSFVAK